MSSLIYDNFLDVIVKAGINFSSDTIKVALVQSGYTPNKGTHSFFSDLTNETTGTGYTAGGLATTPTATKDTTNHREDLTFSNVTWNTATITARAAVIYKSTGVAGTSPLIAYVDFGQDVSSTAAAFSVTFSSALRFQN
jgi:hypothetical protein